MIASSVIVVGAGAMGAATAYHLAKRGAEVTALEQFELGHARGSSHGESRIIRKAYYEHRDYVPLLLRAYDLWDEIAGASQRKLYHQTGIVYFCREQSALRTGILDSAEKFGLPVDRNSAEKITDQAIRNIWAWRILKWVFWGGVATIALAVFSEGKP